MSLVSLASLLSLQVSCEVLEPLLPTLWARECFSVEERTVHTQYSTCACVQYSTCTRV